MKRRTSIALAVTATLVLSAGGASAWALNEYVVDHVEIDDVRSYEQAHADSTVDVPADGATVKISKKVTGSGSDTVTYYVADVTLTDARQLRSAFADNEFGENIIQNTSDIAAENGALFAINGDYYGFRDTGIVIRNGVIYRDKGAPDRTRLLQGRYGQGVRRDDHDRRPAARRRGVEHALVRAGDPPQR